MQSESFLCGLWFADSVLRFSLNIDGDESRSLDWNS